MEHAPSYFEYRAAAARREATAVQLRALMRNRYTPVGEVDPYADWRGSVHPSRFPNA